MDVKFDIDKLIAVRKEQNITQKQMAELTGLSIATVQAYEQKKYEPIFGTVNKMCEALRIPVAYVISNMDELPFKTPYDLEKAWEDATGQPHGARDDSRLAGIMLALDSLNDDGLCEALHVLQLLADVPRFRKDFHDKE